MREVSVRLSLINSMLLFHGEDLPPDVKASLELEKEELISQLIEWETEKALEVDLEQGEEDDV